MNSRALFCFCLPILAAHAVAQNQPLPPQPVPPQNPTTAPKAILGKLLFWEEQLSANNLVACGTCHTFGQGGGDRRRAPNPGPDGLTPSPDDSFGSPGSGGRIPLARAEEPAYVGNGGVHRGGRPPLIHI
ncbi:MAG: cytochrome c peroxidase, partial [Planctomycetota bacterium]